jgi:hypothetical protein
LCARRLLKRAAPACAGASDETEARPRVRTLMAIIAVIALACGITFELKNHAERDRVLRRRADCYREAAIHFRRAWECDRANRSEKPYQSAERTKLWTSELVLSPCITFAFRSWESGYLQHLYWGNRIFDQIDDLDRLLRAIEAKLLIPFPTK